MLNVGWVQSEMKFGIFGMFGMSGMFGLGPSCMYTRGQRSNFPHGTACGGVGGLITFCCLALTLQRYSLYASLSQVTCETLLMLRCNIISSWRPLA